MEPSFPGSSPDPRGNPVQASVVPPQGASAPQVIYLPQPVHPIKRWLGWAGWMGFFLCVSIIMGMTAKYQEYYGAVDGGIQERYHSRDKASEDKVAIIEVEGVIGSIDDFVKKQIEQVRKDEQVKAVVVRVNSPGGTITGSDYIYHHLTKLKAERQIPLVVSMGSIAASGGYYVSMAVGDQAKAIYAEPTTTTGSIGVIIPHYDVSGLLERYDVKDDSIVSHPRKKLLSMTKPMSEDDRGVLEAYMADAFGRFKTVIKAGRPSFRENEAALDVLATGEIFTATQAQTHGLVDELGFIEDALDRAAELAQLDKDKVRVIYYSPPVTLLDALAMARAPQPGMSISLRSFLEFQVPQAYYLATLAPVWAHLDARP
jgi:protease IV